MKTILMLTVGLMLAGCGSMETMSETMALPQPPRDPLQVPVTVLRWTRYALAPDRASAFSAIPFALKIRSVQAGH